MTYKIMNNCIIFDLDGTLSNSAADLAAAINHVRTKHGLAEHSLKKVISFIGEGPVKLMARAFADASELDMDNISNQFRSFYSQHLADHTELYPGVANGLATLFEAGIPLGLVTNKHITATDQLLEKLGIRKYLKIVIGFDSGFPPKPAPDSLIHILAACQAQPDQSWILGDHFTDLESGRRAGIKRAFATWGFGNPRAEIADAQFTSFAEFTAFILDSGSL